MRGLLTTFLIGFAGLVALFAGPFVLLGTVVGIGLTYGRVWGFVALLVAFVLCSAVMWGLSWVADRRTSQLDLSTARLPRDLLFCQRCGTPAGVGTIACLACGSTRFGLGQPARLAHSHVGRAQDGGWRAPHLDPAVLTGTVQRALDRRGVRIRRWLVQDLASDVPQPISGGVYRIAGTGENGSEPVGWSLVLKIAKQPTGADVEPDYLEATGYGYWRREALVYTSRILDHLAVGLVAPRCYGVAEQPDGTVWIWLEDVAGEPGQEWSLARYGLAARHLGRFNGAYVTGRPLPREPWLCQTWPRGLAHRPATAQAATFLQRTDIWRHPFVRRAFPPRAAERIRRLWDERGVFLAALDRLPKTLCHREAYSRNLLARPDAEGREVTVAIDWQTLGVGALGEELWQLLSLSLGRGDVAPGDATRFAQTIFDGYLAGLGDVGWRGDEHMVRLGLAAAGAVWTSVRPAYYVGSLLDEGRRAAAERRCGQPISRLAECWAACVDLSLELVERSRPHLALCP